VADDPVLCDVTGGSVTLVGGVGTSPGLYDDLVEISVQLSDRVQEYG
jgi:hypothetical protein